MVFKCAWHEEKTEKRVKIEVARCMLLPPPAPPPPPMLLLLLMGENMLLLLLLPPRSQSKSSVACLGRLAAAVAGSHM